MLDFESDVTPSWRFSPSNCTFLDDESGWNVRIAHGDAREEGVNKEETMAKREILMRTALGATAGLALIIGLADKAAGQSERAPSEGGHNGGCSVATLQGDYLYTGSAEANIEQRDDPTYPRVFAGVFTFDGAGNLSGFDTRSFGGDVTRRQTFTGTYTVDPDCTGTVHYFSTIDTNWDLFVRGDGSEGSLIRYDPGTIAIRSFKKR